MPKTTKRLTSSMNCVEWKTGRKPGLSTATKCLVVLCVQVHDGSIVHDGIPVTQVCFEIISQAQYHPREPPFTNAKEPRKKCRPVTDRNPSQTTYRNKLSPYYKKARQGSNKMERTLSNRSCPRLSKIPSTLPMTISLFANPLPRPSAPKRSNNLH